MDPKSLTFINAMAVPVLGVALAMHSGLHTIHQLPAGPESLRSQLAAITTLAPPGLAMILEPLNFAVGIRQVGMARS